MDDTLNILNGIPIAISIPQTAVNKGSGTRPDKGDETLVGIPYIDHVIEGIGRSLYLEVFQLAVPELLEFLYFCIDLSSWFIRSEQLCGFLIVLLSHEEDEFLGFTRLKRQFCLQGTAGIAVEIHGAVTLARFYCNGIGISAVWADEMIQTAIISCYRSAYHTEEPFQMIGTGCILAAVFIDVLNDLIALKAGTGDEEGILQIHLILLIVVVIGEFYESKCRQMPNGIAAVGNLGTPNLMRCAVWHIIRHFRSNSGIFCGKDGVSCSMAAFALIGVQRLSDRLPGSRPIIRCIIVPQVDIPSGKCHIGIEPIAGNSSIGARLYETISGSLIGNNSAIFRGTQIIGPGSRCVRLGDDIFFIC